MPSVKEIWDAHKIFAAELAMSTRLSSPMEKSRDGAGMIDDP